MTVSHLEVAAGRSAPARLPAPARLLAVLAIVGAVVVHLVAQAGMMLTTPGWSASTFRNYYSYDQFAYLAIATNGAHGDFSAVEPFTQTGPNHYPRAYYLLVGLVARWTGADAATMWTVLGLAAQALLVAAVGTACVLLTRRWWTGLLGAVPFLLGTGSWIATGSWNTALASHAVLWGPFGVLFTLNGESVALCIAGTALIALLLVAAGRVPRRAAWPVAIAAAAAIGVLANVQTYSFLVATFLLAASAAGVGLVRARSRVGAVATIVLLTAVLLLGPVIAEHAGPLATLVFGLLPAVPGLLALGVLTRWRVLWCVLAFALCAAPQTVNTVLGLAQGDPFLTYREASSKDLGVPALHGLYSAVAVLPALGLVVVAGLLRRRVLWVALPCALGVTWALLASNDVWGANQEPYRFWIDTFLLVAVLVVPLVAWVAADSLGSVSGRPATGPADVAGAASAPPVGARVRAVIGAGLAVTVLVAGVASVDFWHFREQVTTWGYVDLASPRRLAAAEAASASDGGLVLADPCIDPLSLKVVWGGPVAYYNLGLAWPDHEPELREVQGARTAGTLAREPALEAGVRWLVVDPTCAADWPAELTGDPVTSVDYPAAPGDPAGTIELWDLTR